jgi:hypothetical protein
VGELVVCSDYSSWLWCNDMKVDLGLAEVGQDRVDHFEGLVDLFTDLGAGENDLARDEDEKHLGDVSTSNKARSRWKGTHDLGLHHSVDETGEQLRLVRAEHVMACGKTFQADRELDVAGADNVLDLEVGELGIEAELLDDTSVLAGSQLRVVFGLGTSDDHLARGEDQGGGLGLANTHDDSGETLGVVLCITSVEGNRLQIESAVKVHRGDNVPLKARNVNNMPTTKRCNTKILTAM